MKNPHFIKFRDNKKLIKIDKQELYDELQYPPNKIFSTGFSAYLILSKLYPDKEIILVGFTFNVWEKHGLWEKSYFQKHGVKKFFDYLLKPLPKKEKLLLVSNKLTHRNVTYHH